MEHIVGIDLGTTNSLIACVSDDDPKVIGDPRTGKSILPSVVHFGEGSVTLVGEQAERKMHEEPLDTIRSVKRIARFWRSGICISCANYQDHLCQ